MSSVTKVVETMHVLKDIGEGLLNSIYTAKSRLVASDTKPVSFQDAEIMKIRSKIEKKFPALPDTQKLAGWDYFSSHAQRTVSDLEYYHELLLGIAEFSIAAKDALRDVLVMVVDFQLTKNRSLVLLYLSLLASYMRVMLLTVELFEERGAVAALYHAAYGLLPGRDTNAATTAINKIKTLLGECVDVNRHFIDFFWSAQDFVRLVLPQLQPTLLCAAQVDQLRHNGLLNPVLEGDAMGKPALQQLSAAVPISVYVELQEAQRYCEYVVYTLLACPALLFEEPLLQLLKTAVSGRLLLPLCRDVSLNIHIELEKVSSLFPGDKDHSFKVPTGFKLKHVLKTISRESVASAGLQMRARRSLLEVELRTLNNLVQACPGLIGPKFPMLLAAGALARDEVLAYFRHAEGQQVRKDSKAHYNAQHYVAEDISLLLSQLHRSSQLILTHQQVVLNYYMEFLTRNDLHALEPLCAGCAGQVGSLAPYFKFVTDSISDLRSGSVLGESGGSSGSGGSSAAGGGDGEGEEEGHDAAAAGAAAKDVAIAARMEALRLNWDRALAVASSQPMRHAMKAAAVIFDPLALRMLHVCERSRYVSRSSLRRLVDECFNCHQIGWFKKALLDSYKACIRDPGLPSKHFGAFFLPLSSANLGLHPDCPEEAPEVGRAAVLLCNSMLSELGSFVLTLVKFLWDNISALEAQHLPIEAGRRMERAAHARAAGGGGAGAAAVAAQMEALPGCESEHWAKKQIEKLVLIRQHITWLFTAAREKGTFTVYDKEYRVDSFLLDHTVRYFRSRLHSMFLSTGGRMNRFSSGLKRLVSGCRALQLCLGLLHADFGEVLKSLLFSELHDAHPASIIAPGLPVPLTRGGDGSDNSSENDKVALAAGASTGDGSDEKLITKIAAWFGALAKEIARAGSGLVWAPAQQTFVCIAGSAQGKHRVEGGAELAAGALPVELYVHREELVQLATLVGAHGMRRIEATLLDSVAEAVVVLMWYVKGNQSALKQFAQTYNLSISSAAVGLQGAGEAADALRKIGVALALREMLHAAMSRCSHQRCGDIAAVVEVGLGSLDSWAEGAAPLVTPLASLAADLGVPVAAGDGGRDLALCAALARAQLDPVVDKEAMLLLPVAAAALLASDGSHWDRSSFHMRLGVFENNEHCTQLALARLLPCFYTLLSAAQGARTIDIPDEVFADGALEGVGEGPLTERQRCQLYLERYLRVGAQTLLLLRTAETPSGSSSLRSLCLLLELFVTYASCPPVPSSVVGAAASPSSHGAGALVDRSSLERHLPNALLHSAAVDISLGKQRSKDVQQKFSHPQPQEE